MPKINLPELDALREYLTGKVPNYGMFSTLKGLIENSPRQSATAQEWSGYLKNGQMASRAGVDFPLQKEELQYSKIPDFLAQYQPNDKISRDDILAHYLKNAPRLNTYVGSNKAIEGDEIEQRILKEHGQDTGVPDENHPDFEPDEGDEAPETPATALMRFRSSYPQHSDYSHAARSSSGNVSPFGNDKYKLSITTSPDFGASQSHFSPQDISWSRTNQLPTGEFDPEKPGDYNGPTMRLIDEIQSDRHQRAIKPGGIYAPTPEQAADLQTRLQALAGRYPANQIISAVHHPENMETDAPILQDPDYQAVIAGRKAAMPKVGYRDPNGPDPRAMNKQIEELEQRRDLNFDDMGRINATRNPEVQDQIAELARNRDRLMRQVPDTPFKTTQGYAGLEMRRALNDAVQAGDTGLGLATGDDQTAYYGNRFSDHQNEGQSHAYDTVYPSVLRKLSKQYGADFGPMDVNLMAPEADPGTWPPRPMRQVLQGQDDREPTMSNYLAASRDQPEYDGTTKEGEISALSRLYSHFTDYLSIDPHDTQKYIAAKKQADQATKTQSNVLWKVNDADTTGDFDQVKAQAAEHPEWKLAEAQYQDAKNRIVNDHLSPLFDQYVAKYKPADAADRVRNETFQNTMQLTPEVIERAKKAGIPIWALTGASVGAGALSQGPDTTVEDAATDNANGAATGGSIDLIAHAKQRVGFAEGGEVKAATSLGQLVQKFLEHYTNFMHNPAPTDEHLAGVQDLADQIRSQGIEPSSLLTHAPQLMPPGTQLHAEGGSIAPEDKTWLAKAADFMRDPIFKGHADADYDPHNDPMIRGMKSIGQQLYGADENGKAAFLGGTHPITVHMKDHGLPDVEVGGHMPLLLDQFLPLIQKAQQLKEKFDAPSLSGQIAKPVHTYGTDAEARDESVKDQLAKQMDVPPAKSFGEHTLDNVGMLLPVPGLAEEGAASKLLPMLGAVNPAEWAKATSLWAPANGALETGLDYLKAHEQPTQQANTATDIDSLVSRASANAGGMAEGGYVTPDTGKFPPQEPGEPNNHYQARLKAWQQSRPIPKGPQPDPNFPNPDKDHYQQEIDNYLAANPPQGHAGGGEIGTGEKLAALLAKLFGGAEEAAPAIERRVAAPDPMAAHAAEIQNRRWSDSATPDDLFTKVVAQNPSMASLADEIKRRNWLATQANPVEDQAVANANGMDDGGKVDWTEIRKRLAALKHPLIEGTPGPTPAPMTTNNGPPVNSSDDAELLNKLLSMNQMKSLQALTNMGRSTNQEMSHAIDQ